MDVQQKIAQELNDDMIGKTLRVLIDRVEGDTSYGRTEFDSPEADPEVIIKGVRLHAGEFVNVRIEEAYPFELIGKPV